MDNLEFLKYINAKIYKIYNDVDEYYYAVKIPFLYGDESISYIDHYDNCIYIKLTSDFIQNNDIVNSINNDLTFDYVSTIETDIKFKEEIDSLDYTYYARSNEVYLDFSEDDISSLNSTFMNILKTTDVYNNPDTLDYLYKYVIDFYSNGQYDDAIILMNTIFNTQISTTQNNQSCGCNTQYSNCQTNKASSSLNTGTDLVNIDNATCMDKYKAAMYQWLQQMLSDYNFYCHWLFVESTEEKDTYIPNNDILDKLIKLLKTLLSSSYNLNNLGGSNIGCGHSKGNTSKSNCNSLDEVIGDNSTGCTNSSIISNYINALELVKEDKVIENKNKIYIYGKQFAEIFPLLNFS